MKRRFMLVTDDESCEFGSLSNHHRKLLIITAAAMARRPKTLITRLSSLKNELRFKSFDVFGRCFFSRICQLILLLERLHLYLLHHQILLLVKSLGIICAWVGNCPTFSIAFCV